MTDVDDTSNNEDRVEKPDLIQQQAPKNKVQSIFHELEIMAMQKGGRNSLDLNRLSGEQIDKVLDTMAENEKNAFAYHSKKLDAIKEIELRKIDSSVINQRTIKYLLVGLMLGALTITILILFFKEKYFISWLTFLTGILGGFGLSRLLVNSNQKETQNPIKDEED